MGKSRKRHGPSKEPRVAITDLIDKAILQALQDRFSEKYRVPSGILDENANPITFERRHSDFCKEIRKTQVGYELCRDSDRNVIGKVLSSGKPERCRCRHGRLRDFAYPLYAGDKLLAYFFIGQIKGPEEERENWCISKCLWAVCEESRQKKRKNVITEKKLRDLHEAVPTRTSEDIELLFRVAKEFTQDLSSALSKVMEWRRPSQMYGFVSNLARVGDLDTLYDTCVREIPKLMGTRNCSILTVVYGKRGAKPKLVLQRTNFRASKENEGTKYYTEGKGLTGWVWKNRRALRLDDLNNEAELAQYAGLEWARVVDDSSHHQEWLGVPLIGSRKGVIGVIRVPQKIHTKRSGGGGFSFEDEVLLTAIGQNVAQRIEEIRVCERVQASLRACQECAVALSHVRDQSAVAEHIIYACEKIFGVSGKAHFVNMLTETEEQLRPLCIGGSLVSKRILKVGFPLTSSLSGFCLLRQKAMIVHDLPMAEKKDRYFRVVPKLKCGMAAPIIFNEKKFGVLSVGSDRQFEFTEEPDLHILTDLASIASAAFARLEAERKASESLHASVRSITHTLGNRIPTLKIWVGLLRRKAGYRFKEELRGLEEGIDFISGAVAVSARFGRLAKPVDMERFELSVVLRRLQRLYPDRRVSWHIRGRLPMVGDPRLIEQAMVELLTNALRFVQKQKGRVEIRAYRRKIERKVGTTQRVVIIRVDDNGPGVAADRKEGIFQMFDTSDPSIHFGLGLGFVHSVAQRHGGYIEECGGKEQGASFRMVFLQ